MALLASVPVALAALSAGAQAEIHHLFETLAASDCRFYRNGSWHDAQTARAHLKKKYDYLVRKNLIHTAEDFIAKGGSTSSSSGEPYQVECKDGRRVTSAQWLTEELQRLRKKR